MPDTRRSLSALQTLFADNSSGDISAQDGRDELISSHPEKVIQSDTQANEPGSGRLTGDLFLPSDGFQIERYSGSAWLPWGPIFPFTKPVDGDFSWVNQGSASKVTTYGGVYLQSELGITRGWSMRAKTAPTPPYTITACMLMHLPTDQYYWSGIGWRQSSDGKLVTFHRTATQSFGVQKYASPTSYSASYRDGYSIPWRDPLAWLRIVDDNTNRKTYTSADGKNWILWHSVGRTDFITADQVWFGVYSYNSNSECSATLLSWKEE